MFKLIEKYDVNRDILKCDYIRYSPSELTTINTADSQSFINIPRGDAVNSLFISLLGFCFDVFHAVNPNNRYVGNDNKRLFSLGTITLFTNYKLTSSNGKHIEEISNAHIACLMSKLINISKDGDDLSIGLDRDGDRRRRELTNNKNIKCKYHVRIMLREIFGFAEHQQKATYGLGYKLILTRNSNSAVLNKGNAINDAKIKISSIEWLFQHYTRSVKQQTIIMNQIVNKEPTELHYVERSVFMQKVKNQKVWQFQIGVQEGISIPIFIIFGFQQQGRENSQNPNNDTFCRLPIVSAQCIIGTKKYPDGGSLLSCDDNDYSQGYGQIKEAFRTLTKDDILKPYTSEHDFGSSNDGDNIGCNLYVFDIRYQKILEVLSRIK